MIFLDNVKETGIAFWMNLNSRDKRKKIDWILIMMEGEIKADIKEKNDVLWYLWYWNKWYSLWIHFTLYRPALVLRVLQSFQGQGEAEYKSDGVGKTKAKKGF